MTQKDCLAFMDQPGYWRVFQITWLVVFFGAWAYCVVNYGFLFGFGLGWLPAAMLATIAAVLWPALLLVIFVGIVLFFRSQA